MQAIRFPREDSRSSTRCTTTSSGRALRMCCSSVSRVKRIGKDQPVVEMGTRRPFLFPRRDYMNLKRYRRSRDRRNGIQRWRCGQRECDRPARFRKRRRSFQTLLCRPNSTYWSAWRRRQCRCFLQIEHLAMSDGKSEERIAILERAAKEIMKSEGERPTLRLLGRMTKRAPFCPFEVAKNRGDSALTERRVIGTKGTLLI